MPHGYKTPGVLAAEIKIHRKTHPDPGAFLLVEGKDDVRFWKSHRDKRCELIYGEGKKNVLGALGRLERDSVSGVLGVVDSDYDTFKASNESPSRPSRNLVVTDAHDLECVLLRSEALERVLAEHADDSKVRRFEDTNGTTVREALLERALVFGRVRLVATLWNASEVMPEIRVHRFVDEETWDVDADSLIDAVADNSHRCRRTWKEETSKVLGEDPWFVARGHDMLEILRVGLKKVLGDMPQNIGTSALAGNLRLAMSREWLEATKLWEGMRFWEDKNPPFRVLPQ